MLTFNEWLQELTEEDEAWFLKQYDGDLEAAYNAQEDDYEDMAYEVYKDEQRGLND